MFVDYLVVGAGLTGATIARLLKDAGREVLVVERRPHVGGNVYDFEHSSGIRVHAHGPHYFRTNSQRIWQFVTRFGAFRPFEAVIMTMVAGQMVYWPMTKAYIDKEVGVGWQPPFSGEPRNFEEASLKMVPRPIYDAFIREYSEKQWGAPPTSLSPKLAARFEVRSDGDRRLSRHKWQGVPADGYTQFVCEMLRGIPVTVEFPYEAESDSIRARKHLIFTGAIDAFFNRDLGRLDYRCQHRVHRFYPDVAFQQPVVQVNNPSWAGGDYIRTIEWKHLLPPAVASEIKGTLVTWETPAAAKTLDELEYPFPDERNRRLYEAYRSRAERMPRVTIAGRLGEYRYYDMDQAIARALVLGARVLSCGV